MQTNCSHLSSVFSLSSSSCPTSASETKLVAQGLWLCRVLCGWRAPDGISSRGKIFWSGVGHYVPWGKGNGFNYHGRHGVTMVAVGSLTFFFWVGFMNCLKPQGFLERCSSIGWLSSLFSSLHRKALEYSLPCVLRWGFWHLGALAEALFCLWGVLMLWVWSWAIYLLSGP